VSFGDAATVFGDPLAITYDDPDHLRGEDRYITIGSSSDGRLLIVEHTNRGNHIRIKSARESTSRERKFYEQG
jgi:hypothetical protein